MYRSEWWCNVCDVVVVDSIGEKVAIYNEPISALAATFCTPSQVVPALVKLRIGNRAVWDEVKLSKMLKNYKMGRNQSLVAELNDYQLGEQDDGIYLTVKIVKGSFSTTGIYKGRRKRSKHVNRKQPTK